MNRIFIQSGITALFILFLVIEKSLYGTFGLFNILQISLIGILVLINIKSINTYLWILFCYGLALDILNHTFIGLSSLILTISLYLFYTFQIRFDKNKIFVAIVNLIFAYILAVCYLGFRTFFSLEVAVVTLVSFFLSAVSWFRFQR